MKLIVLSLFAAFLVTGCAGTPDVNPTAVQQAQEAYKKIESDTLVVKNAPMALKKAEEAVENANHFQKNGNSPAYVAKHANMAMLRVEIARKTAELKASQDEFQKTSSELRSLEDSLLQNETNRTASQRNAMSAEESLKNFYNFEAQRTDRGWVVRFKNISFASEKASLTSRAERPINELTDFLLQYPERNMIIEGHTDNTGSESFNRKLSQQRADVIRNAIIARGISDSRIMSIGFGEQYPVESNKTEAGRRINRRVEVFISDISGKIPDRHPE
jgi:outer membrane protein OmpA-like peptidoglycan-associated protein